MAFYMMRSTYVKVYQQLKYFSLAMALAIIHFYINFYVYENTDI